MAGRMATMVGLAAISAVLAAFVPGISSEARGVGPTAGELPGFAPELPPAVHPVAVVAELIGRLPAARPQPASPSLPVPSTVRSFRVPVGCDRLVSALARSAAATQVGRCVT